MLYTLPTEEFQIVPESTQYVTSAGTQMTDYVILKQIDGGVYLDLEFVSQYTDMTYTAFEDPARVVVRTKWSHLQLVTAQKNSEIRQKGGIKSPIVAKVKEIRCICRRSWTIGAELLRQMATVDIRRGTFGPEG